VSRFRQRLGIAAEFLEHRVDGAFVRVQRALGTMDRPIIAAYDGFGDARTLHLTGRVLEDKGISCPTDSGSWLDNLRMMYRRAASEEIPGALVEAEFEGTAVRAKTDDEGYFEFTFRPAQQYPAMWVPVELRLIAPMHKSGPVAGKGSVMVPPAPAKFGVISDLDDTVLHTDVTNLVKMARILALSNARTRMPFAGVAAFYRALHNNINPIFYLSSSPWNLYDLLHDFLEFQSIPRGPLLLRDWGISAKEFLPLSHTDHKLAGIRRILEFYPQLPFILIGDSGQQDPEIYLDVVKQYGERILAVYIRNIRPDLTDRVSAIEKLFKEALIQNISLKLVPDTVGAARDAAEHGWIDAAALPEIGGETRQDKAPAETSHDIVSEKTDRVG